MSVMSACEKSLMQTAGSQLSVFVAVYSHPHMIVSWEPDIVPSVFDMNTSLADSDKKKQGLPVGMKGLGTSSAPDHWGCSHRQGAGY